MFNSKKVKENYLKAKTDDDKIIEGIAHIMIKELERFENYPHLLALDNYLHTHIICPDCKKTLCITDTDHKCPNWLKKVDSVYQSYFNERKNK